MKSRKFVCVDVDGTLLDFQGALKSYFSDKGIDYKSEKVTSYNFDGKIGCKKKDVYAAINETEFYKHLKEFNNAITALDKLQDAEVTTLAYTASVVNSEIYKKKCCFINRHHMPGIPYIGKKPVIKDAAALFDDCLEIHKEWIEQGYEGKLYLIDAPYNRECNNKNIDIQWEKIIRCDSFADAVNDFLAVI